MMKITECILAKCDNRQILAKESQSLGNPDDWFNKDLLCRLKLKAISFDFFINWEDGSLDRTLWLKRPIESSINLHSESDDSIIELLKEDKFRELVSFAKFNNLSAAAILFNNNQTWNDNSPLIYAFWPKDISNKKGLRIERVKLKDIKDIIKTKSGGPVRVGSKGLIYGTSSLECYLSKTDALWPGDADLILFDDDYAPRAVIELKKHTESSRIKFSEQKLSNYYPYPDGRKYDRLQILSCGINNYKPIPLYVVYYSTIPGENDIIVEEVWGDRGKLQGDGGKLFTINLNKKQDSFEAIVKFMCKI